MKGIFITTSAFAQPAIEYAHNINKKIVLIDGEELTNLMIDHDIGVTRSGSYDIKKIDSLCKKAQETPALENTFRRSK